MIMSHPHLNRRRQKGQVLIFAVMIMLIILVVIFFLYDVQNVIRVRATTQNGADAAALTAAAWQGRTLNTIGELNLIKASTMLIYGIPPTAAPDEPLPIPEEELLASVNLLTNMQTRLTYVGPLIGLAAAQQSAKGNALRTSGSYTSGIYYHINTWMDWRGGSLYENIYGNDPRGLGYNWISSYQVMLEEIAWRGIAARPVNSRYLFGSPHLNGSGADLLLDLDFYRAVHSRNYCWFYQRGMGPDAPPIDISAINLDLTPESWFPGSEILPLYVEFGSGAQYDPAVMYQEMASRELEPIPAVQPGLPEITWAVYDLTGDGWGWGQTAIYDYVNGYLRSDFRREYTYGGAAARIITHAAPSIISGRWSWKHGQPENEEEFSSIGSALNMRGSGQLSRAEYGLRTLRSSEMVESVSAAKPFGRLGSDPPHRSGIVLPVFEQVRLIPVSLLNSNIVDREPSFYRFLIEYFGHPDFPDVPEDLLNRYAYFLSAINLFNNMSSDFRVGWFDFDDWRNDYMAGEDGILGNEDDQRDPCEPVFTGGPGGGSRGGPGIIH